MTAIPASHEESQNRGRHIPVFVTGTWVTVARNAVAIGMSVPGCE